VPSPERDQRRAIACYIKFLIKKVRYRHREAKLSSVALLRKDRQLANTNLFPINSSAGTLQVISHFLPFPALCCMTAVPDLCCSLC